MKLWDELFTWTFCGQNDSMGPGGAIIVRGEGNIIEVLLMVGEVLQGGSAILDQLPSITEHNLIHQNHHFIFQNQSNFNKLTT